MTEEHPFHNRTMYGATKIAGEQFFRAFHERHGLDYVGHRYMNIYGPRMDYRGTYVSVIMKVLDRIDEGLPPLIYGDGSHTYDFVHVEDVARANILSLKAEATDTFFNVGTGIPTTIRELVDMLLEITGSEHRAGVPAAGGGLRHQPRREHRARRAPARLPRRGRPARGARVGGRVAARRPRRSGRADLACAASPGCSSVRARPADRDAPAADGRRHRPPRAGRRGPACRRPARPRQPPAGDHRPDARRRDADGLARRPLLDHLQRRGLQLRRAAPGARGGRTRVPLAHRHRGRPQRLRRLGAGVRRALQRHVRARDLGRRAPRRCSWPATASASSPSTTPTCPARSCSARRSSRCWSTTR